MRPQPAQAAPAAAELGQWLVHLGLAETEGRKRCIDPVAIDGAIGRRHALGDGGPRGQLFLLRRQDLVNIGNLQAAALAE